MPPSKPTRRAVCQTLALAPFGLGLARCRRGSSPTVLAAVDASATLGAFDRLSGVQGSPAPLVSGEPTFTEQFKQAHLERSRFPQDCEPNTLTLGGTFPDENADPSLEASYRFAALDAHVRAALDAGVEILWQSSYDVGGSDAWVGLNLGGRPPSNLGRWSQVLLRSLEHLNNGWAGGFQGAVRSVEFLNEPNGLGGFRGADAGRLVPVFLRFLETIDQYNAAHPATPVQAVGPGIPLGLGEWPGLRPLFEQIASAVQSSGRALPVFSFHTYGEDVSPRSNARLATALRAMLDAKGLSSTALWNTEWQAGAHVRAVLGVDAARVDGTEAEQRLFASGVAAYALACKMRWQGVVTGSFYYRANLRAFPPGYAAPASLGLGRFFKTDGRLGTLGLHEQLTHQVRLALPERCPASWEDDGQVTLLGLRAADKSRVGVLAASLSTVERPVQLTLEGLPADGALRVSRTAIGPGTEALSPEALPPVEAQGGRAQLTLALPALSSWLLTVER